MELFRKVRLACADGTSKRAVARHFNISRDTGAKSLVFSVPPCYRRTAPIKRPKLDASLGTPPTYEERVDLFRIGHREIEPNPDGVDFRGPLFESLSLLRAE